MNLAYFYNFIEKLRNEAMSYKQKECIAVYCDVIVQKIRVMTRLYGET